MDTNEDTRIGAEAAAEVARRGLSAAREERRAWFEAVAAFQASELGARDYGLPCALSSAGSGHARQGAPRARADRGASRRRSHADRALAAT